MNVIHVRSSQLCKGEYSLPWWSCFIKDHLLWQRKPPVDRSVEAGAKTAVITQAVGFLFFFFPWASCNNSRQRWSRDNAWVGVRARVWPCTRSHAASRMTAHGGTCNMETHLIWLIWRINQSFYTRNVCQRSPTRFLLPGASRRLLLLHFSHWAAIVKTSIKQK